MFPGAVYKFTYLLTYVWCHLFLKTNLPITNGNRRAAEMTSTTVGDRWFAVAAANPRYCYRNPHPGHLPRMPRLSRDSATSRNSQLRAVIGRCRRQTLRRPTDRPTRLLQTFARMFYSPTRHEAEQCGSSSITFLPVLFRGKNVQKSQHFYFTNDNSFIFIGCISKK